jgi:hypothetical protein
VSQQLLAEARAARVVRAGPGSAAGQVAALPAPPPGTQPGSAAPSAATPNEAAAAGAASTRGASADAAPADAAAALAAADMVTAPAAAAAGPSSLGGPDAHTPSADAVSEDPTLPLFLLLNDPPRLPPIAASEATPSPAPPLPPPPLPLIPPPPPVPALGGALGFLLAQRSALDAAAAAAKSLSQPSPPARLALPLAALSLDVAGLPVCSTGAALLAGKGRPCVDALH